MEIGAYTDPAYSRRVRAGAVQASTLTFTADILDPGRPSDGDLPVGQWRNLTGCGEQARDGGDEEPLKGG